MDSTPSFGRYISNARKALDVSQKDLAANLGISPQYLNDIEQDRRSPSSDEMIQQLASILSVEPLYLHYLAGRLPRDRRRDLPEEDVVSAMSVFRGGPTRQGRRR